MTAAFSSPGLRAQSPLLSIPSPDEREAKPSAADSAPRAAPGGDQPVLAARARRLAALFAEEPELIRACLENIERESTETVELILAAAQTALIAHPGYADLFYHAGQAAVSAGQYETASRLLDDALRINPGYRDALVLAARVALLRGRASQAKPYLQAALAKGAEYPDVYMLLGNVWRSESRWREARASYRRALELNSDLTAAREALATLPYAEGSGKNNELPA